VVIKDTDKGQMNNDPVVKLILNYEKNTFKRGACDIHAFFKNILETTARTIILLVFTYPIFNYMIYPTSLSGKSVFLFWRLIDFFRITD
jgi:hypothetical protein